MTTSSIEKIDTKPIRESKVNSPGEWMLVTLKEMLPLEPLIDRRDWWVDEGRSLTRVEFVKFVPQLAAKWDDLEKKLTFQGKLSKPIGPEFCVYRGNKQLMLITTVSKILGTDYLDAENPIAIQAEQQIGADVIARWRREDLDAQKWYPQKRAVEEKIFPDRPGENPWLDEVSIESVGHGYQVVARSSIPPEIWDKLRKRAFLMMTIVDYRKNSSHGDDTIQYDNDMIGTKPEELHILYALGKIAATIIEEVDRNSEKLTNFVIDPQLYIKIQPYLVDALRDYDPGVPEKELVNLLIRKYIGQDRTQQWEGRIYAAEHAYD